MEVPHSREDWRPRGASLSSKFGDSITSSDFARRINRERPEQGNGSVRRRSVKQLIESVLTDLPQLGLLSKPVAKSFAALVKDNGKRPNQNHPSTSKRRKATSSRNLSESVGDGNSPIVLSGVRVHCGRNNPSKLAALLKGSGVSLESNSRSASVRDRVGVVADARLEGGRLVADVRLNQRHEMCASTAWWHQNHPGELSILPKGSGRRAGTLLVLSDQVSN